MAFLDNLQLIVTTPAGSGDGDNAFIGGNKINGNFIEVAGAIDDVRENLDNILTEKSLSFVGLDPAWNRRAKAAAAINALPSFVITAVQTVGFSRVFSTGLDTDTGGGNVNVGFVKEWYYIKGKGKGTYGTGGTQILQSDIVVGHTEATSAGVIALGNIVIAEVWDYMTANGPYIIAGTTEVRATQGGDEKRWLFIGADGTYGTGATEVTANNFLEITDEPIVTPFNLLPVKPIDENPYTITDDDLNRPLVFTSNNQVVNIPVAMPEAAGTGLSLFDFKAKFTGTGTHTVNYPDSESWTGSQGALVYALCIDTVGNTVWTVKQWWDEGLLPESPTGLEAIDEGNGIGWRLIGRNPANYGNIGLNAVDVSESDGASSVRGATGANSRASGLNTIASGARAIAEGHNTTASAQSSKADGFSNIASGWSSYAGGEGNFARSRREFSIGEYGTDYTPGPVSGGASDPSDRLFNIGNGTSNSRSNAFTIFRNGAAKFIVRTLAGVSNAAAGFFVFNSADVNRPTVHNGTEWKGLAYKDEAGVQDLQSATENGNETDRDVIVKADFLKGFIAQNDSGETLARMINEDGESGLIEVNKSGSTEKTSILPSIITLVDDEGNSTDLSHIKTFTGNTLPLKDILGRKQTAAPNSSASFTIGANPVLGGNVKVLINRADEPKLPATQITLTGTSGSADIIIAGFEYNFDFDTDLTTTAAAFVTSYAAAILAATGQVVTSSGAVISFLGFGDRVKIANATSDLNGTMTVDIRKRLGSDFQPDTDMYMVVEQEDGFIEYQFQEIVL
jgi:hypothetical protein